MARIGTAKLNSAKSRKTSGSSKDARKENTTQETSVRKVTENGIKFNKKVEVNKEPEKSFSKEVVLALGGDDKDFDDLKDFDSDTDLQAINQPVDAKLSKEIASFVKSLNISKKYKDIEDEDEDQGEVEIKDTAESDLNNTVPSSKPVVNSKTPRIKEALGYKSDAGPSKGKFSSKTRLIIKPDPQWYSAVPPLSAAVTTTLTNDDISKLQVRAETLFKSELDTYASSEFSNSLAASSADKAFLQQILTGGTLSDRLSALTLLAQSSPVHNTKALESLRSMSQKKGREESLKAMRAIVDWWTGGAPDRKLKHFRDQPLSHPLLSDSYLLIWYFEDWLKKYFFGIIQTLETLSLDPLPYVRMQTISLIFGLLRDKPEQEQNLLRLLVNKLGDSEKQVAARASYHLLLLLQTHPQMKSIITKEVASLVLRPSSQKSTSSKTAQKKPAATGESHDLQRSHIQYYGVITLNQITLMPKDHDVAIQLLNVYFDLFKEILGEDAKPNSEEDDLGEEDTKGDNEADVKKGRRYRPKLSKKGGKKQKKDAGFAEVEDSRSKLVSAILTGVNRAFPYTKQGVATDDLLKRIDIIFRITHTSTFNISIQALRFILNLCATIASTSSTSSDKLGSIPDRYYRTLYNSLEDSRLATSSKQAMYLNLLFKSLKVDKDKERVKSFVRRFVQLLWCGGSGGAEFAAGGLYLLAELVKYEPGLQDMFEPVTKPPSSDKDLYDPRKRDPKYANASASSMWEFTPLLYHYHPTVRLHATQLISNTELSGSADLTLNTLSHFLDRFVYKNPKKKKEGEARGMSAMQPAAMAFDTTAVRVVRGKGGESAVNEDWFINLDRDKVPVDELFFHQYFNKKKKYTKKQDDGGDEMNEIEEDKEVVDKTVKDTFNGMDADMDEDNDDSDSDESEIWQAIKQSVAVPDGDEDDNDDVDDDDEDLSLPDMSDLDGDDDDTPLPDLSDLDDSDDDSDDDNDDDSGAELFKGFDGLSDEGDAGGELPTSKKRSLETVDSDADNNTNKKRKKKKSIRSLPTFASYDDYAEIVEDDTGLDV